MKKLTFLPGGSDQTFVSRLLLMFRILCEVPQGDYQELLCFGCTEPSSRSATDVLQQLLLQRYTE